MYIYKLYIYVCKLPSTAYLLLQVYDMEKKKFTLVLGSNIFP